MNDIRFDAVKDGARNTWENMVQALGRLKELVVELSNPSILSEQLRIIFRDESEYNLSDKRPIIPNLSKCFFINMIELPPNFQLRATICFSYSLD